MHTIHNDNWIGVNGNETLITNYPLTENSWVIEMGGYEGWWTNKMIKQHNCKVLVLEPVFHEALFNTFKDTPNVYILPKAITADKRKVTLNVSGDGTSETLVSSGHQVTVDSITLEDIIERHKMDQIGLIQMNIEGEEYNLLPALIQSKVILKTDNIHIQFHRTNGNYEEQRAAIQEGLRSLGFEMKWCYDYVWESWTNTHSQKYYNEKHGRKD